MEKLPTKIKSVYILRPQVFKDNRGWFFESYNAEKLKSLGIETVFIQDNHSLSKEKGIIRGLHCQKNPHSQTKLIRCTKGKIIDVIVDIRKGSPSYLKHEMIELSEDNFLQVYIPKGCLHGFITLTDVVEVQYKVDDYYSKECDRSIRYDDPEINIPWPFKANNLSEKDKNAPLLKDSDVVFNYEED